MQRDTTLNIPTPSWKVLVFLFILMKHEFYPQIFETNLNIRFDENPAQ
jgi:hypothetical protein